MGIKVKLGSCIDCEPGSPEKPLTAKRCQFHYWNYRASLKPVKIKEIGKSDWKEAKRKEMNAFLKTKKPIPKVSQKQVERLAQYRKVRDQFMKEHLLCQAKLNGCTVKATDLHHLAGRLGDALTDKKYFMALCRTCHNKIEDGGKWVYDLGFKIKRLEKL